MSRLCLKLIVAPDVLLYSSVVDHHNGVVEVTGSNPLVVTPKRQILQLLGHRYLKQLLECKIQKIYNILKLIYSYIGLQVFFLHLISFLPQEQQRKHSTWNRCSMA